MDLEKGHQGGSGQIKTNRGGREKRDLPWQRLVWCWCSMSMAAAPWWGQRSCLSGRMAAPSVVLSLVNCSGALWPIRSGRSSTTTARGRADLGGRLTCSVRSRSWSGSRRGWGRESGHGRRRGGWLRRCGRGAGWGVCDPCVGFSFLSFLSKSS